MEHSLSVSCIIVEIGNLVKGFWCDPCATRIMVKDAVLEAMEYLSREDKGVANGCYCIGIMCRSAILNL